MFALLIAFLKLYQLQQKHLNEWPKRHLNYYLYNILNAQKKTAVPDHTFVQFNLKESAVPHLVKKGTQLLADISEEGLISCYETEEDIHVNKTQITGLQTIYLKQDKNDFVQKIYHAPIANSINGIGQRLEGTDLNWPLLGEDQSFLPEDKKNMIDAELGLVIGGPILMMEDGIRTVEVKLLLQENTKDNPDKQKSSVKDKTDYDYAILKTFKQLSEGELKDITQLLDMNKGIKLNITLENGWHPIKRFQAFFLRYNTSSVYNEIKIRFEIPTSIAPIKLNTEKDSLETYKLPLEWPAVKISLNPESEEYVYSELVGVELKQVEIHVGVKEANTLNIINSGGVFDNNQPFPIFGNAIDQQANFLLGKRELFLKNLLDLEVKLMWDHIPVSKDFSSHYTGYINLKNEPVQFSNKSFKIKTVALVDGKFDKFSSEKDLFDQSSTEKLTDTTKLTFDREELTHLLFKPNIDSIADLDAFDNQTVTGYFKFVLSEPSYGFGEQFYTNSLSTAVTHNAYTKAAKAWWKIKQQKEVPLPNPPFSPKVKKVTVSYTAESKIQFNEGRKFKYQVDKAMQIYQVQPTGYLPILEKEKVIEKCLIRPFVGKSCLMIGLTEINFEKPLNLFFKISNKQQVVAEFLNEYDWYYLSNNQFLPFTKEQLYYDTTYSLGRSGVISLHIPIDINKENTLLPNHSYWIMVASKNKGAYAQVEKISLNAVKVKWIDNGDLSHYHEPSILPPISSLQTKQEAIAEVVQLDGFEGGKSEETDILLRRRMSERLKHKARALTIWDYERLVLAKFSDIRQAKCIPVHSNYNFVMDNVTDKNTRGLIRIVLVSDSLNLENLCPTISLEERLGIKSYLQKRMPPDLKLNVINPAYEHLKLKVKILLDDEVKNERGVYLHKIYQAITQFICPWVNGELIRIGDGVGQRALLDYLLNLPYIKYLTSLSVVHVYWKKELNEKVEFVYEIWDSAKREGKLSNDIKPSCPWGILVPAKVHDIEFLEQAKFIPARPANVDDMIVGTDFIIGEELELFDENATIIEEEDIEQISFYFNRR